MKTIITCLALLCILGCASSSRESFDRETMFLAVVSLTEKATGQQVTSQEKEYVKKNKSSLFAPFTGNVDKVSIKGKLNRCVGISKNDPLGDYPEVLGKIIKQQDKDYTDAEWVIIERMADSFITMMTKE